MKEIFIVAQNVFSVSVPDGLPAWEALAPRYRLFASSSAEKPVMEVNIKVGALPECDKDRRIYEPEYHGVGGINSRASRLCDDSLVIEFKHISDRKTRLWMKISPLLDNAEIILRPEGNEDDQYLLTHALMIAYLLATGGNGTLLIHASAVLFGGRAYLFQGKSGTGKSTHASLWTRNIAGAELLNDDNPVIRFSINGEAVAYGSPWSGKTPCYRNTSAPVGAFVRIVRAEENDLRRLAALNAYASLTASVFYMPFLSEEFHSVRHVAIERLVGVVPCFEMHCRPDADAAFTCLRGLLNHSKN